MYWTYGKNVGSITNRVSGRKWTRLTCEGRWNGTSSEKKMPTRVALEIRGHQSLNAVVGSRHLRGTFAFQKIHCWASSLSKYHWTLNELLFSDFRRFRCGLESEQCDQDYKVLAHWSAKPSNCLATVLY
ncbi:hypothetical protein SERLA73DRAFT_175921 [Serpula lacrymans var. lacrymans S7.3]|uniref:Uncharacterized protein n=2 Tax=Serpula lacrymans var. lacrymans TaxID=341189 RepID=F8PK01_SERL3|nr:uncharacterized protein SERLADRAFT_458578 [Serpula lacrymans var. lacrymans S7.9]EGO04138.1 hypothetical protein SERLA73DRAFT_175921 [Serpula lacrymans var. lacrymans S7.3]EGO30070.1 hypothetical protein SERLADRAFT_458578 [Serpula lacrymans var. lacrymans S7.9]